MNVDIKIGNCVKKPEMVSGLNMARIILAVNDNFVKEDGTRGVNYFNIVVWNKLAENCVKYLDKGSKIAVYGRTQNKTYNAKDGTQRFSSEIVAREIEFLSEKKSQDETLLSEEEASDIPF